MAEKACVQRLQKEFRALCKEPVAQVVARPSPDNILEWLLLGRDATADYVLEGSPGTPFSSGFYYGKVKFPPEYPFKPPSIYILTPNGRFATNKRICMSMSDFHPESWNPMWSAGTILTGLLSFMMENELTTGSIRSSDEEKRLLARESMANNCKSPHFQKMFPEYVQRYLANQHLPATSSTSLNGMTSEGSEGKVTDRSGYARRKRRVPLWLIGILVAVFAAIMALPLLTLDLH